MRAGQIIALLVLTLFVFGVVMVASARLTPLPRAEATIRVDQDTHTRAYIVDDAEGSPSMLAGRRVFDTLLGKDGRLALLALGALLVGAFVPVERLASLGGLLSPAPWLLATIVGLLLMTLVVGEQAHGATRWLRLGPVRFQPSEVAKWGLPAIVAWHCIRHADGMRHLFTGFAPPVVLSAIVCALIAKEDLGTAALVMSVSMLMVLAAGARWWHVAMVVPAGILAFVGFVFASPYRINRITAFLEPFRDAQDTGYQVIQSMGAIAGGGFGGRGLGHSLQKFDYLPFDHTDFIFAIICEELGFFGAAMIVAIFLGILVCGWAIVTGRSTPVEPDERGRAVPPFSALFGFGIVLTFGLQAVINIAVVTGMAPTKGIALPLVSQGGTGWVLTAFSLGLLISIDRQAWSHWMRSESHASPDRFASSPAVAMLERA